ncbi:SOS response-associated peptidase [Ruegeria atlantica]|uniref:SOS response-associated peptidase n=1 Tax=Ruegeria atlantica TaxID=81569 RepID=UPI002494B43F|nr:SOS response-associated peptidase family protein [Ruegeria atlantica]
MCNLYANMTSQQAMRQLFDVRPEHDLLGNSRPQAALFPDAQAPIVRIDDEGNRTLMHARWGWNKAKFGWVTNIRNLGGWPWKYVIQEQSQRCLVPASSFSEYHPTEKITGKTGKPVKAAAWFRLTGDEPRRPFAFAGFSRRWNWEKDGLRKKSDEDLVESDTPTLAMAFMTTEPNEVVAPIHPKAMPVILRTPEEFEQWLHGSPEEAAELQRPLPDDALEIAFVGEKEDHT